MRQEGLRVRSLTRTKRNGQRSVTGSRVAEPHVGSKGLKQIGVTALSVLLTVILLSAAAVPALAAEKTQPRVCSTFEELSNYLLDQLGDREPYISVTIPDSMPGADVSGIDLIWKVLESDSGFIRWGYKGGTVRISKRAGATTLEYNINYYSTKEQDSAARAFADDVTAKWNTDKLTDREKVDMLRVYISTYWRYDESLVNKTAYSVLTTGSGTCLGFVLACQLMLDSMDIPSQTVHGSFLGIDDYHIMLLVKLGEWWYTLDPSDLAREKPLNVSYLRQSYREFFTPKAEYLTDSFRSAHPMNESDLAD